MISVKFTEDSQLTGPCDGLHKIQAVYALTSSRWCDAGPRTILVDVYVDSQYATISQAHAAGSRIYDEIDCTSCATAGWYGDVGGNICYEYISFEEGCFWDKSFTCGSNLISVRGANSKSKLCDNVGILYNVYTDDSDFGNATGMWENDALTITANVPNQYYKDAGSFVALTRYWTDTTPQIGGVFGSTEMCSNDPQPSRYEVQLRYNSSSTFGICNASSVTGYLDHPDFALATTIYLSSTGSTKRNDGYYVIDSSTVISHPNETSDYPVRRLRFGTLQNTTDTCQSGSNFDGEHSDDVDGAPK